MKNNSLIFALFILLFAACSASNSAQNATDSQEEEETLVGEIVHKPWKKSGQSYCAGGSDYFVLKNDSDEEFILEMPEGEELWEQAGEWVGKTAKVVGFFRTKRIKHVPMSQHPVETDINGNTVDYTECTVFKVLSFEE